MIIRKVAKPQLNSRYSVRCESMSCSCIGVLYFRLVGFFILSKADVFDSQGTKRDNEDVFFGTLSFFFLLFELSVDGRIVLKYVCAHIVKINTLWRIRFVILSLDLTSACRVLDVKCIQVVTIWLDESILPKMFATLVLFSHQDIFWNFRQLNR